MYSAGEAEVLEDRVVFMVLAQTIIKHTDSTTHSVLQSLVRPTYDAKLRQLAPAHRLRVLLAQHTSRSFWCLLRSSMCCCGRSCSACCVMRSPSSASPFLRTPKCVAQRAVQHLQQLLLLAVLGPDQPLRARRALLHQHRHQVERAHPELLVGHVGALASASASDSSACSAAMYSSHSRHSFLSSTAMLSVVARMGRR